MPRPEVAVNIAFSFYGLCALEVPTRTLRGLPDEFIDGMMKRAPMLGDNFSFSRSSDWKNSWDEVWTAAKTAHLTDPKTGHILVTLNAQMKPDGTAVAALDAKTDEIETPCKTLGGVEVLPGHNPPGGEPARYQELSALMLRVPDGTVVPSPKEHFGYTDAIGDPVFEGQYPLRSSARAPRATALRRRRQLAAVGHRRVPARLSGRGAGDLRQRHTVELQPQRHLHGVSQAASERRRVPQVHRHHGRRSGEGVGLACRRRRRGARRQDGGPLVGRRSAGGRADRRGME